MDGSFKRKTSETPPLLPNETAAAGGGGGGPTGGAGGAGGGGNGLAALSAITPVVYPISCVECRRRKIRCSKRYPCHHCVKKNIKCEFPEKFRSIEINDFISNKEYVSNSNVVSPLDTSGSNILSSTISVNIARENELLKKRIADLEKKLRQQVKSFDTVPKESELGDQNDNDTELSKEKYYGPNSSLFMIKSTQDAKIVEFNEFMKEKKNLNKKRELPNLISNSEKFDKNSKMTNFSLICKMVTIFFKLRNYCNNLINENEVFDFLHNYTKIKHWSNDDDMLLLIIILVTTIRSIRRDDPILIEYKINPSSLNKKLMYQYEQLKLGIANETLKSLKSYVLACEHYYYQSQAETSWNLLFHTVSNAYSLGLHVYDKEIEISLRMSKENTLRVIQNDPRTSLWLTINFISSVLCSVVGRPNPVSFTFQPLTMSQDINLNYKIALSEITKSSTKVLIDSYRVSISYADITRIDEDFEREIDIYERLFKDTCEEVLELERQELERWRRHTKRQRIDNNLNECDLKVILNDDRSHSPSLDSTETEKYSLLNTPCETLCDLILIYSNRAKFHQPFMSTYQTSTKILLTSVSKTFQHSIELVKTLTRKINNPDFQSIYPFFYCFLYQSFIVFYTFLHLNFEKILFFYKQEILEIHRYLQTLFDQLRGYWKKNAMRIIEQIFELVRKFKEQYASFSRNAQNTALYPSLSGTNLSATSSSDQQLVMYDSLQNPEMLLTYGLPPLQTQPQLSPPASHAGGGNGAVVGPSIVAGPAPMGQPGPMVNNPGAPYAVPSDPNNNVEHNMFQWDKNLMDQYGVDPILGFDLNDPFFMANPEAGIPNDYFGNVQRSDGRSNSNSTENQLS